MSEYVWYDVDERVLKVYRFNFEDLAWLYEINARHHNVYIDYDLQYVNSAYWSMVFIGEL